MGTLIIASQFILALAILITIHEFGHFLAARAFKTRVEKFYLFFNPWFSIFKKKIGDTEWGLGWLPLGGYVKISGMIDESMDTEQLKQEPQPWEFRSKPAWQRLIIMLGGIIVNLIFGYLVYILVFWAYGRTYETTSNENGIYAGELFKKYGFEDGDHILKMGDKDLVTYSELTPGILFRGEREFLVRHQNGVEEKIVLPDDIDYQAFKKDGRVLLEHRVPSVIGDMDSTTQGAKVGLQKGDRIIQVDGTQVAYFHEISAVIEKLKGKKIDVLAVRNMDTLTFNMKVTFDKKRKSSLLGITQDRSFIERKTEKYSLAASFGAGWNHGNQILNDYASQLKFIFTKKGAESLGGFITIANIYPDTWNWSVFWTQTAFISFILAFMNLLPIPALDGGHVLFLLVEMVIRRPLPQKFLEYAQMVGIFLLLGLMLYANGNDVVGLFKK